MTAADSTSSTQKSHTLDDLILMHHEKLTSKTEQLPILRETFQNLKNAHDGMHIKKERKSEWKYLSKAFNSMDMGKLLFYSELTATAIGVAPLFLDWESPHIKIACSCCWVTCVSLKLLNNWGWQQLDRKTKEQNRERLLDLKRNERIKPGKEQILLGRFA